MADPLQGLGFQAGLNRDIFAEQKSQLGQAAELAKQKKGGLLGSLIGGKLGKFAVNKLLGTYLKAQFGPMGLLIGEALGTGIGAWGGSKMGTGRKKDVGADYGAGTGLLGSGYERLGELQDSISGMARAQGLGAGVGTFVSGLGSEALGKAKNVFGAGKNLDPVVSADSLRPNISVPSEGLGAKELDVFNKEYGVDMTPNLDMEGLEFPDYSGMQESNKNILGLIDQQKKQEGVSQYWDNWLKENDPQYGFGGDSDLSWTAPTDMSMQRGGLSNTLLGMQMGGMPGTSSPIPYQDGGEAGLQYAENYEYSPSGLEKILDVLPLIGGKRDYDRAEEYIKGVHYNPEDMQFREAQDKRGMDVIGKDSRFQQEDFDISTADKFQKRALTMSQEDPRNFTYRNIAENNDLSSIDQFITGSPSGHVMETDDTQDYAVDPHNIVKSDKRYSGLLGMLGIPKYSGSVKENPGIDPYIDPAYFKEQITQTNAQRLAGGGYMQRYNMGGSVAQQPMSYQIGGLLKYKRNPMVG